MTAPDNTKDRDIVWACNRLTVTDEEAAFTLRQFLVEEITTKEGVDAYFVENLDPNLRVQDHEIFLDWNTDKETAYDLAEAIGIALRSPYSRGRDTLTEVALSLSLCPYHFVDYAICFDDLPPECAMIRFIHPGHDT